LVGEGNRLSQRREVIDREVGVSAKGIEELLEIAEAGDTRLLQAEHARTERRDLVFDIDVRTFDNRCDRGYDRDANDDAQEREKGPELVGHYRRESYGGGFNKLVHSIGVWACGDNLLIIPKA